MAGILTYIIKFCVDKDFKVDDGIKKNVEGHWFWQLKQLKTKCVALGFYISIYTQLTFHERSSLTICYLNDDGHILATA